MSGIGKAEDWRKKPEVGRDSSLTLSSLGMTDSLIGLKSAAQSTIALE